jgi:predicted DCC family thiol-disulfide oxidoreductase YuxK
MARKTKVAHHPTAVHPMPPPILLYDGVCGICNRFVQFILRHDSNATFRFAWLQGPLAAGILKRHAVGTTSLDTVYVVENHELPDERLLARSDAVIFVLRQLGGIWRFFAFLLQLFPKLLRDAAYQALTRHRYRIFGRSDVCTLPRTQDHSRFLDR